MKKILLIFMCLVCCFNVCSATGGINIFDDEGLKNCVGFIFDSSLSIWGLSTGTTFPIVAGIVFGFKAIIHYIKWGENEK